MRKLGRSFGPCFTGKLQYCGKMCCDQFFRWIEFFVYLGHSLDLEQWALTTVDGPRPLNPGTTVLDAFAPIPGKLFFIFPKPEYFSIFFFWLEGVWKRSSLSHLFVSLESLRNLETLHCFLDISLFVFLTAKMLILIPKTKAIRIFIDFLPRVSFLEANSAYVNSFTERLQLSLLESWWELHILVVAKNRETKMMFVRYAHSRHQGNEDDIGTYLFFSSSFTQPFYWILHAVLKSRLFICNIFALTPE